MAYGSARAAMSPRRTIRMPLWFETTYEMERVMTAELARQTFREDEMGWLWWKAENRPATRRPSREPVLKMGKVVMNSRRMVWLMHAGAWPIGQVRRYVNAGAVDIYANLYDTGSDRKPVSWYAAGDLV